MKSAIKYIIAVLMMVSLVALTGCGTSAPATPVEKTILKVGTEAAYAPFEYKDEKSDTYIGFDLDLVKAVAEASEMDAKIENIAWEGLVPALNTGKVDVVISAMSIQEERKKNVLFSDNYFQITQLIAVKEVSTIKGSADLIGKKVGVQANTTGQFACEKLNVKEIKKYDTTPEALNALKIGAVDAVVADAPVVKWFIIKNPDSKVIAVQGNFEKEFYGMAMKLDNKVLADKINAGLKKVIDSGKYNDIYKKYFNEDAPKF